MAQENYDSMVLLLFPSALWKLYGMELRRLRHVGNAQRQGDIITSDDGSEKDLRRIIYLCEAVRAETIYNKVGKSTFRTQKKFLEGADDKVRRHVQNIISRHISEAVMLSSKLGIHLFFKPAPHEFLEPENELHFVPTSIALHTLYRRTDDGLDYRLTIGRGVSPSEHRTVIICNEPSLFCVDNTLYHFDEGLNGNLLRPFLKTPLMHIPARMQSEYFRKMILRIAGKIDIEAEGIDVMELHPQGECHLLLESVITGGYHFRPTFHYAGRTFNEDSHREKVVTLHDDGKDVSFVCIHRNREWEHTTLEKLRNELHIPSGVTLQEALAWARDNRSALKEMAVSLEQLTSHKYYIGDVHITDSQMRRGDWFQLHIVLHFDNGLALPLMSLRDALLHGDKEFKLPDGNWFVIPDEWLARYSPMMLFGMKDKDNVMVHRSQSSLLDELSIRAATESHEPAIATTLPKGLHATLRPYQQEGYRWLLGHINASTGCCLADDMGLGKTVQSIAVIMKYKESEVDRDIASNIPSSGHDGTELSLFSDAEMAGKTTSLSLPVLVLAPASVVYNWRNEIRRFAPSLRVLTYSGTPQQRQQKLSYIDNYDVLVTTYATMRNDIDSLCRVRWGMVFFDESQLFKNNASLTYEAVRRLTCPRRIALSGTPMENNLHELWTLMNILNPQLLGDKKEFQKNFVHPINENLKSRHTEILRQMVAPFFLRRTKAEVLDSLPERQDETVYCDMAPEQASLYAIEQSRMRNFLLQTRGGADNINALTAITRLRQIACAPEMIGEKAPSGKLAEVFERLDDLRGTSHKVLIFSEFVKLLDVVAKEMDDRGWAYAMLTGATTDRESVIRRFQEDDTCQFFLISLKAGGIGLNLTEADYVFLLDPWWNATAEEQAISRAHRQGQRRSVFVYRFISTSTLEEQILKLQDRKQSLINAVLSFMVPQGHTN